MMKEDSLELEGSGLKYYRFAPPNDAPPTAIIHIVHGVAEHVARYRRLAETLVQEGWIVYAPDQRGHGRSALGPENLGFFAESNGWATVVEDLRAFVQMERAAHPDLPLAIVGHSMGSLVVQDYLSRYEAADLSAAALSGTSGPPPPIASLGRLVARIERARLGKRGRSALMDKLAFGAYNKAFAPTRTASDWLSRDSAEVDAYIADPHCGFIATNQAWVDLLDALPTLTRKDRLEKIPKTLPVYLFSGSRDPVGQNGAGVRALEEKYRKAGIVDVTVRLYADARHEILNETNRQEVIRDLVSWLRNCLQD